jgi:hypothetical protein
MGQFTVVWSLALLIVLAMVGVVNVHAMVVLQTVATHLMAMGR